MPFSIPFDCSYYDTIIFMYGGFTDAEFLCGGADRGPVLYDVKSEALRPLLHIFFQTLHSPPLVAPSYANGGEVMSFPKRFRGDLLIK